MTTILTGFRWTLLGGAAPSFAVWTALTLATVVIALFGYAWFMQTRKGFADVM